MSPRPYLNPGESVCRPGQPCKQQPECCRAMLPTDGRQLADFSSPAINAYWKSGTCPMFVRVGAQKPPTAAPKPAHEHPGGLL